MQRLFIAFALLSLSGTASAHARWTLGAKTTDGPLKPRTNSTGLKEPAPCGGVKADESRRATLVAGETIEVTWEETIQHPGYYSIAFAKDGETGFDQNFIEKKIVDDQDAAISGTTYHQFKATIKVPSEPCDKCAFQLIQYMTDRNPPTNYYSCADVKIVADGSGTSSNTSTNTATGTKPTAPAKLKVTVKKVGEP